MRLTNPFAGVGDEGGGVPSPWRLWMMPFAVIFIVCGCTPSPGTDCLDASNCAGHSYPTEENLFDSLLKGEAQLEALCGRLIDRDAQSTVRSAFCPDVALGPRPIVKNSQALLATLGLTFDGPSGKDAQQLGNGNPAWAVLGHSAALSRRSTSPVNPRVIVHTPTPTHLKPVPGFVVVAFSRGEGFAEIITHDPVRDDLDFFLFKFTYPCKDPQNCTDEERYGAQHESNWLDYTIYGAEDLENTPLDCFQCHERGLRTQSSSRKSLLMFQLNSMWMHWMYDNRHFEQWTDNPAGPGPFHDALVQYMTAHGTATEPLGETFGGVPGGSIYGSRPRSLEDLIEGNGFGNGFDQTVYEPNGSGIGLLEDHRALGLFFRHSWEELYEMNLNGLLIAPPGRGETPFDANKMDYLTAHYRAYRNGETPVFPNVLDIFEDDNLNAVGLRLLPNLSAPEMLVQGCSQCHHDGLNPKLTRAEFQLGPRTPGGTLSGPGDYLADQTAEQLERIRERINLPEDHLRVMPPFRFRSLSSVERSRISKWLDTLRAGLTMADDGLPPSPLTAEFDRAPAKVTTTGPYVFTDAMNEADVPDTLPSMALMRAQPGTDPAGYVEYYFEETSGSPGATSSGWQLSPRYLDTGLRFGETYSYRVKMRDRAGNEGAFSEARSFHLTAVDVPCDTEEHAALEHDADCDTVPDEEEFDGDTDGDGLPDYLDSDDDGDGFSTRNEREDGEIWGHDNDNDGKPAWVDLDSDGDGYSDQVEGGGDTNSNLIPGYLDPDEPCGDGVCSPGQPERNEDCLTCPADCACAPGTTCVDMECVQL